MRMAGTICQGGLRHQCLVCCDCHQLQVFMDLPLTWRLEPARQALARTCKGGIATSRSKTDPKP